jgi:DUF2075 family protein
MELYNGHIDHFIEDTTQNRISTELSEAFFNYFGFNPSQAEKTSWTNSLRCVKDVFQHSGFHDHGIMLEYQLPLSSRRLDCMICGTDKGNTGNAVIIELKQWEACRASSSDKVVTWTGGGNREVLHPSAQVGNYKLYLENNHSVFYEDNPVTLSACAYLHNYTISKGDPLLARQFEDLIRMCPIFSAAEFLRISDYLKTRLEGGDGMKVLERVRQSKQAPSRKFLMNVTKVIKEHERYTLLDEQLIAFDKVLTTVKTGLNGTQKSVVIVNGGPGTGKSVIAINLLADLSAQGYNVHYATGSKAFTETLRKTVGRAVAQQFKYFNSYMNVACGDIDVIVADEAHRIRENSNNRYTPRSKRSSVPQVQELINAAKLPVFFIDDRQNVRPGEIGSSRMIRETARNMNCKVFEYQLDIQFRCQGSDLFVQWINNTLEISKTAEKIWEMKNAAFEFRIVDSPHELYRMISKKNKNEPNSARMVAGFCWKWSFPKPDGTLVKDVQIGDFAMTWEGKEGGPPLASEVPPASLWPFDPRAVDQIGSIYTIQGFEFDYVGVIFGPDLKYSFEKYTWEGFPKKSADSTVRSIKDPDKFLALVKNTYRVLLSRALKGCYVYFVDKDTEKFFKTRMMN